MQLLKNTYAMRDKTRWMFCKRTCSCKYFNMEILKISRQLMTNLYEAFYEWIFSFKQIPRLRMQTKSASDITDKGNSKHITWTNCFTCHLWTTKAKTTNKLNGQDFTSFFFKNSIFLPVFNQFYTFLTIST